MAAFQSKIHSSSKTNPTSRTPCFSKAIIAPIVHTYPVKMALQILVAFQWMLCILLFAGDTLGWTIRTRVSFLSTRPSPPSRSSFQASTNENTEQADWRQFRAKLVQQQKQENQHETSTNNDNPTTSSDGKKWAYEAGTFIEKGSLLLSRVESSLGCHDLRQPYFHKAAVLVLEHDADSTRGIVLNRPSNLMCSDGDILLLEDDIQNTAKPNPQNQWPMHFGGDIAGLFSDEPMIVVLHSLTDSELALEESSDEPILPDIWVTSHSGARSLVAAGEAGCDDFVSFYGFCLWEPGQLQREIDRGSWYSISMDSQSIWESLRQPCDNPQEAGLDLWEDWTTRIGKAQEERVEESRNAFSDLILKEWCREMLTVEEEDDDNANYFDLEMVLQDPSSTTIGPGSLVRASEANDFRLFDQLFHKSTILILKDNEDLSLGLILNLPTTEAYQHELPDGTSVTIPIRYGGPLGQDDGDDDNQLEDGASRIVWLHCHPKLSLGQLISSRNSPISTCSQQQALEALDRGLAQPTDFLAVQGYAVWEKESGAGGIAGEIVAGSFEPVPSDSDSDIVDEIWSALGSQSQLTTLEDVQTVFEASQKAWSLGREEEEDTTTHSPPRLVHGTNVTLPEMADEALRKWIEIFLLDNRKYEPF